MTSRLAPAAAFAFLLTSPLAAGETSYFRQHGGVAPPSEASALPQEFTDDNLLWRTELPPGHSTPCVSGARVFVTSLREEKELVTYCLDRSSGEILWERVAPADRIEPYHEIGSPAVSTPASDGERVFVFFGSFGLLCYDFDGNVVWKNPMGPFRDEFEAASSPILVDGKLILNEDHDIGSFLIAIDPRSGKTLWRTERPGFTRSYATPVVWKTGETTQIVVAGALQLTAYDVEDGSRLWWINGLARIVNPTPAVSGGMLFVPSWSPGGDTDARISMEPFAKAREKFDKNEDGKIVRDEVPEGGPVDQRFIRMDLDEDGGLNRQEWEKYARVFELAKNGILAVRSGGRGNLTESHFAWSYHRGVPYVPSPLIYQGVLYVVKDGGILSALDPETGEVYEQGRLRGTSRYFSSPVAGDGKVFACSESGVLTVIRAGREWETLSSRDFEERIMATPVIDDNHVYIRSNSAVYAFTEK